MFGTAGELDNARIEVQTRDHTKEPAGREGIIGLTIRVNELDAVAAMLDMGRIPHSEAKHHIVVPAQAAHGVCLEFAED